MLMGPAGIEPATFWSPGGHATDWATEAGLRYVDLFTDRGYTFPLDAACKEKAEKELHEKDEERVGCVKALREWALQRQDWLKTPVGKIRITL